MVKSNIGLHINSIRAGEDGWQAKCWKVASAKEQFELEGCGNSHHAFIQALCAAYGYCLQRKIPFLIAELSDFPMLLSASHPTVQEWLTKRGVRIWKSELPVPIP